MAASYLALTVPGPDPTRLVFRGFNSHLKVQLVYYSIGVKMKALLRPNKQPVVYTQGSGILM